MTPEHYWKIRALDSDIKCLGVQLENLQRRLAQAYIDAGLSPVGHYRLDDEAQTITAVPQGGRDAGTPEP